MPRPDLGVNWNQKWGLPTIVAGPTGTSGYIMNRPAALKGSPACLHSTLNNATTRSRRELEPEVGTAHHRRRADRDKRVHHEPAGGAERQPGMPTQHVEQCHDL